MKLIIVAPHFPPSSLPPSQRVRLMLPHLKSFGISTTVFTTYPRYREEAKDPWIKELCGNDFELKQLKSLSQSWTRNFGIGDLGLRMIPYLFFSLLKYCKRKEVNFVLYPVPPWYILLVAPLIKSLSGVPYGIDFIDPWVSGSEKLSSSLKRKLSQSIARSFEGWVCKHASVIYSVSEGINAELIKRHSFLERTQMVTVPYGAEKGDYNAIEINRGGGKIPMVRYIGAVWEDAYPVLGTLLEAFSIQREISLEFYGTSYAGEGLAKKQLGPWLNEFNLKDKVTEFPLRVPYKEAIRLNLESDLLLLFGGMKSYYAASKLFGLIVSGKPFLAFLHRESFPAKFLKDLDYSYLLEYSEKEGDLPKDHLHDLGKLIERSLQDIPNFEPLDLNDPRIQKHTAFGMTKAFAEPIKNLIDERL